MKRAIDMGTLRRLEVSNQPIENGHYDAQTGTVILNATILATGQRTVEQGPRMSL